MDWGPKGPLFASVISDGKRRLEFFRFSSNRENTLTLCFGAFLDGKLGSTFPGNALASVRMRNSC
jgi:hypothetical protein